MKIIIDPQKIKELLTRGVEKIYPNHQALEAVLMSGKKIRLYNGIDPTGKLHLGHLAVLKKMRQFQDLGHEVIILIGDFTATIGDPTDKFATRRKLSKAEVLKNAKNYKKQIGRILDLNKANVKFLHNEKWSNRLKPIDLLDIFSYFTVARLLERDMFQKRIKEGKDILLHEFIYPVFQAYDSVTMDVDLEIGGNDQTFNMLRGRDLMKKMKGREKFVMALKLLTDSTGKKMGKTEGNMINLDESPNQMFGKIMSWPDSLLRSGFELLTDTPSDKVEEILKNPREAKARLAREIAAIYHGEKAALSAEAEFNKIFRDKELPSALPEVSIEEGGLNILDLLIRTNMASSKSEARRLVEQGGVEIDGEIKNYRHEFIKIKKGQIVQVGKRKFAKII